MQLLIRYKAIFSATIAGVTIGVVFKIVKKLIVMVMSR